MGRQRSRERTRRWDLGSLHEDSFTGRMLGHTRAPAGRGGRRALLRNFLLVVAGIAAVTVPLLLADLIARLFD